MKPVNKKFLRFIIIMIIIDSLLFLLHKIIPAFPIQLPIAFGLGILATIVLHITFLPFMDKHAK